MKTPLSAYSIQCRSRKGAWIEILTPTFSANSFIGRSRKGAWIEIAILFKVSIVGAVAPARERGLKFESLTFWDWAPMSLPQGSVD